MNFLSLVSLLLKLIYEQGFKRQDFDAFNGFVNFDSWLQFFFTTQLVDVFVVSMSSISFMKQLISWIPNQFRLFTDLLSAMVNKNQLKLILVSLYILFGCTITLTLMLNQY